MRGRRWAGQPTDSADPFAGQLAGKVSGDPVQERYMGGAFCAHGIFARRTGTVVWREAMTEGTLYIGHKRYSSWSMRGWLAVQAGRLWTSTSR